MNNLIDLDFESEKKYVAEKTEDIYTRLCRLAATAALGGSLPITDIQKYFYSQKTKPYDHKDPRVALGEFVMLCKEYQKQRIIGSAMGLLTEKIPVSIAPTYVTLIEPQNVYPEDPKPENKAKIEIVMGDLHESLSHDKMIARDVANILTVYTTCEKRQEVVDGGVSDRYVIKSLTPEQQGRGLLYAIDAEKVRRKIKYPGLSNISTRDGLLLKLTSQLDNNDLTIRNKARAIIYMLMDDLASSCDTRWVKSMSAGMIKIYNKYKPEQAPQRDEMVMFHYSKFAHVTGQQDHNFIWTLYLGARQVTGGGREGIFSGYSLLDTAPGASKQYEEAMDIVNCAKRYGYTAVRLMQANIVLSNILVASGLSVYCSVNGRGIQKTEECRIYHSGNAKTMIWFHNTQKSPEIKGKIINFPPPPQFYDEHTFMYVYIPSSSDKNYKYLPSMKAASGVCIMTNVMSSRFECSIPQLLERFHTAQLTRAQFIFCRITFPAIETMKDFYSHAIVLPRTKEGEEDRVSFDALVKQSAGLVLDPKVVKLWEESGKTNYLEVDSRAGLVDPSTIPKAGAVKTAKHFVDDFKNKVSSMNKSVAKDLFLTIAFGKIPAQPELRDCVASIKKANALKIVAQIHKFEGMQKIDSVGNVEFLQKNFWPDVKKLNSKKEEVPPPPKEMPAAPEEEINEASIYGNSKPLNFTEKVDKDREEED
jgi:hypothetical protein